MDIQIRWDRLVRYFRTIGIYTSNEPERKRKELNQDLEKRLEELEDLIDVMNIVLFAYMEWQTPGIKEAFLETPGLKDNEKFKRWLEMYS